MPAAVPMQRADPSTIMPAMPEWNCISSTDAATPIRRVMAR